MKKIVLSLVAISLAVMPVLAFAQIGGERPNFSLSLEGIGEKIANAAWIVFTIIAIVCFVIAGVLFLAAQGNPERIAAARNAFLWGVAGVVVGVLAFTIISIVKSIFF